MGISTVCGMLKSFSFYPEMGHWMSLLNLWPLFLKDYFKEQTQLFPAALFS